MIAVYKEPIIQMTGSQCPFSIVLIVKETDDYISETYIQTNNSAPF